MHLKTENFEGPVGLLLDLIERKKMPISEVSLAAISGQFLNYLKTFEKLPYADTASFIETASILMLIKSRSLLPQMEISEEERQSIEELEKRLDIYKFIRDVSGAIKDIYGKNQMFVRESFANIDIISGIKPANLSLENILEATRSVISFLPQEESLPQVKVGQIIKLEEKISELAQRIQDNIQTCFSDFSGLAYRQAGQNKCGRSKEELSEMKTEIIVSFLALLELVKQGIAMADQENAFGDINVKKYG
ncbi:MAG: Segregation and condensation protein A [Parcubacteria group bacterium GW2011_GWB1_43_8]|nr:MAG: Segregation and condensation protein A [Parcubacteria group bacterium GW2011_GWB1_43_8]